MEKFSNFRNSIDENFYETISDSINLACEKLENAIEDKNTLNGTQISTACAIICFAILEKYHEWYQSQL